MKESTELDLSVRIYVGKKTKKNQQKKPAIGQSR